MEPNNIELQVQFDQGENLTINRKNSEVQQLKNITTIVACEFRMMDNYIRPGPSESSRKTKDF